MNTISNGRIFWGSFLVLFGALFLLDNYHALPGFFSYAWDYWPLIFILIGAGIMTRHTPYRWIFSTLAGILLAVLLFSLFSFSWFDGDDRCISGDLKEQQFSAPVPKGIKTASFDFSAGAVRFYVDGPTDQLFDFNTETTFLGYHTDVSADSDSGHVSVSLDMDGDGKPHGIRHARNTAHIRLNDKPAWDMKVGVGAANMDVDISPFEVRSLKIECGASKIRARMGDRAEDARVNVQCGASSIELEIPSSVGAEIHTETALSGKHFNGFSKVASGHYQTDNFENAAKKIHIDVSGGVSSIHVYRY